VYWDEPTMTMDYETHVLHETITKNWKENRIPNVILSSATLPKMHELADTVSSFREKFRGGDVMCVMSHESPKSIPLTNKFGYVVLPHTLCEDHESLQQCIAHCETNPSLLRYFDLREIVDVVNHLMRRYPTTRSQLDRSFPEWNEMDMKGIKMYYLQSLKKIPKEDWEGIYTTLKARQPRRIRINAEMDANGNKIRKSVSLGPGVVPNQAISKDKGGQILQRMASEQVIPQQQHKEPETQAGIYVTTKDAFTLTDGPTLFLAQDVEKIAKFCIQQANIPVEVMKDIKDKIEFNNRINKEMGILERDLEDMLNRDTNEGEDKKMMREKEEKGNVAQLRARLEFLRSQIRPAQINEILVPNKHLHLQKWVPSQEVNNAFTCDIEESVVVDIMTLEDVSDSWKILLLMGIGVFTDHNSIAYTEIMKKLADEQKLYLIIASSDYIYGTNYQFCHGYLSKDLCSSQEKIIQALGRIGRHSIHQENTIRFRDDEQLRMLFFEDNFKTEVRNMNRLFC
jgi:hypothetical protein